MTFLLVKPQLKSSRMTLSKTLFLNQNCQMPKCATLLTVSLTLAKKKLLTLIWPENSHSLLVKALNVHWWLATLTVMAFSSLVLKLVKLQLQSQDGKTLTLENEHCILDDEISDELTIKERVQAKCQCLPCKDIPKAMHARTGFWCDNQIAFPSTRKDVKIPCNLHGVKSFALQMISHC